MTYFTCFKKTFFCTELSHASSEDYFNQLTQAFVQLKENRSVHFFNKLTSIRWGIYENGIKDNTNEMKSGLPDGLFSKQKSQLG
jgi:hypothetical protein